MADKPERVCDLVMKGGITSGVAYPLASVELAKHFTLRNIGGTSVGAIAAALAAAAEHARGTHGAGFDALEKLPAWFAGTTADGRTNLFALFRPDPATAPLFNLFQAHMRSRGQSRLNRAFKVVRASLAGFPWHALAGAVPGLLLAAIMLAFSGGVALVVSLAAAALMIGAGAMLMAGRAAGRVLVKDLPANFYGICSGAAPAAPGEGPPLTEWVADTIDRIAGRDPAKDPPLTFGDLWTADRETGVNLQMMTTNLTQGRPMRVPFDDPGMKGIGQYYFDPEEMRRLFPERIVEWMIEHAAQAGQTQLPTNLIRLPKARDLPVAVGVRLSVSYPLLLSAVPLYTHDWTRERAKDRLQPDRCWFSDGGLSSNFPVHFFDNPLPRWPTFAINFRPPHPDMPDELVWMPKSNRERGIAIWNRFDAGRAPTLGGFLATIKDVTQNWMDNEQVRVPGFRDRIVHITLQPGEGGVNLDMPPAMIADIAERGRVAGQTLAERFASGPQWEVAEAWEGHRWVRFRSSMYALEGALRSFEKGLRDIHPGDKPFEDLAARAKGQPPLAFPWWNANQRDFALASTKALREIVASWRQPFQTFGPADEDDPGPPEPTPEMRIVPRI
ncbi:MAG TPA: hypothetical protein VIF14_02640 [Alphaproteobacteria bacterium]|jgi:predicted acylesterase/phospholipase RssA